MPRSNDIASLGGLGPGSIPKGAVEDVSLRNPERDTLPLTAHVQDPSRAHMASAIGIVDAGGFYSSDEVEGALQEIGGAASGGRQNGVLTGFGYSAVGLVVTFDSPSEAMVPTLRDYSGEVITLPDNTPSVWVYISPATGLITQFLGANPPSITSPENVLLWRFATLAGAITSARDARLYVRNLDRKLPFTVRSVGSQGDQESEACFVTLDAALTYMQFSGVLGGLRTEVVVRGSVSTGPVDIPVGGFHLRGEDGAALVLTSGAYLFDVRGIPGVLIEDVALRTDVAGAAAVVDSLGNTTLLTLSRCTIAAGTSPWQDGVLLPSTLGRATVSNCIVEATSLGIGVDDPDRVAVLDTAVTAVGFTAGSIGVRLGSSPAGATERAGTVRGCTVTGFDVGVEVSGVGHSVVDSVIVPGTGGDVGILVTDAQDVSVSGCRVDCSVGGGLVGLRAAGTAAAPVVGLRVSGSTFYGATTYGIDLRGFVQEARVYGNQVDCNLPGAPADPTALCGILVRVFGAPLAQPAYVTVADNTVWRSATGIFVQGAEGNPVVEVTVTGNTVHHCAVGVAGAPATAFDYSTGIGAEWCEGLIVSNNTVYEIGSILTDAGLVVQPTPADVYSIGVLLRDCLRSGVAGNGVRGLTQKGAGIPVGIHMDAPGTGSGALVVDGLRVSGNGVADLPLGRGILLTVGSSTATVDRTLSGSVLSSNTLSGCASGIEVSVGGEGILTDLRVEGNSIDLTTVGGGITLAALTAPIGVDDGVVSGVQIVDNTVVGVQTDGITLQCGADASMQRVVVDRNVIQEPTANGVTVTVGIPGGAGAQTFDDISISENQISMSGLGATDAVSWTSVLTNPSAGFQVRGNNIQNAVDGFEFLITGPTSSNIAVTDLVISDNSIFASGRGVYGALTGFVNRMRVEGNTIVADNTVCQVALAATAASATPSRDLRIADNSFRADPAGANVQLLTTNTKVHDVMVAGNAFVGGAVASTAALNMIFSGTTSGSAAAVRDVVVRDNTFRDIAGYGLHLSVPGPTDPIHDVLITGNTFEEVATDVAGTRGSPVRCDLQGTGVNLAVRGNTFSACGHASATHGGVDITLRGGRNILVEGNQFGVGMGAGIPAPVAYGNIVSVTPAVSTGALYNVRVVGNTSRGVEVPVAAALRSLVAVNLQTFTAVEEVEVSDNTLNRVSQCNAIRIPSDVQVRGFACDRNRITGADAGTPITFPAIALTFDAGLVIGSVCGNTLQGTSTLGLQGTGISVVTGAGCSKLRVCDNTLAGDITAPAVLGIRVEETGAAPVSELSMCNNSASDFFEVYKVVSADSCSMLTFANNRCDSQTIPNSVGWTLNLGVGAGTDCIGMTFSHNIVQMGGFGSTAMALGTGGLGGTNKNFVFTGNVFRGSKNGISYSGLGTAPDNCTFMGNIGDNNFGFSWSQFESGGTAGWTNVLPPAGSLAGEFQNFNIDYGA